MQLPTTHYFGLPPGLMHLAPVISLAVIAVIAVLGGTLALTLRSIRARG